MVLNLLTITPKDNIIDLDHKLLRCACNNFNNEPERIVHDKSSIGYAVHSY